MKRLLVLILALVLSIGMVGCGANKQPVQTTDETSNTIAAMPQFNLKDINDQTVTNAIFKDYQLTVINIWATTCKPCVDEMPDLAALHQELKEQNVNVVGIVVDGMGNESQAQAILDSAGVTYTNIVPDDEKFLKEFLYQVATAVPTTIFVNEKGEFVGKAVVGARDKEQYAQLVKQRLKELPRI